MHNIIQHPYNKIKRKFDIKKALYKATFGIFMILQLSNYRYLHIVQTVQKEAKDAKHNGSQLRTIFCYNPVFDSYITQQ